LEKIVTVAAFAGLPWVKFIRRALCGQAVAVPDGRQDHLQQQGGHHQLGAQRDPNALGLGHLLRQRRQPHVFAAAAWVAHTLSGWMAGRLLPKRSVYSSL
jgi:hypothetical protein